MRKLTKEIIYSGSLALTISSVIFFLYKKNYLAERIVKEAEKYLGLKEIKGNKGFYNKVFEQRLTQIGWQSGYSWCGYFVKLVLLETFAKLNKPEYFQFVSDVFTGSTQQTWDKLYRIRENNLFKLDTVPRKGDIVFFQKATDQRFGHTGIVLRRQGNAFETIEGNIDDQVAIKTRYLIYNKWQNNLWLLGFVRFKN